VLVYNELLTLHAHCLTQHVKQSCNTQQPAQGSPSKKNVAAAESSRRRRSDDGLVLCRVQRVEPLIPFVCLVR
jgi:hypothetical protein